MGPQSSADFECAPFRFLTVRIIFPDSRGCGSNSTPFAPPTLPSLYAGEIEGRGVTRREERLSLLSSLFLYFSAVLSFVPSRFFAKSPSIAIVKKELSPQRAAPLRSFLVRFDEEMRSLSIRSSVQSNRARTIAHVSNEHIEALNKRADAGMNSINTVLIKKIRNVSLPPSILTAHNVY